VSGRPADESCVEFLQWALPQMGLRWAGYRKVRRQVCRRLRRRMAELGVGGFEAYRARLAADPAEWRVLEDLTHITISRFYRDGEVFDALFGEVLPALIGGRRTLTAWSAGAAGGEEAYTLAIGWRLELGQSAGLTVLGTDIDETMLARARRGCYTHGSLKDLPPHWRQAFTDALCLRDGYRKGVTFDRHDVRTPPPLQGVDLILCRYLAFTYFEEETQVQVARALAGALRPGGALATGTHETVPAAAAELEPWPGRRFIYRRSAE